MKVLGVSVRHVARSLHFDSIGIPEEDEFRANILAQKHSSPGPDSIPFAAYKAIPETAASAVRNLAGTFVSSSPPSAPPHELACLSFLAIPMKIP